MSSNDNMKTDVNTKAVLAKAEYWFIVLTWIGSIAYTGWLFYEAVQQEERMIFHPIIMVMMGGVGLLCAYQAPVVAEIVTRWLAEDSATDK